MILKELDYSFCSFVAIKYSLSTYHVPGSVLNALCEEFHLILGTSQKWVERLGNLPKVTQLVGGPVGSMYSERQV